MNNIFTNSNVVLYLVVGAYGRKETLGLAVGPRRWMLLVLVAVAGTPRHVVDGLVLSEEVVFTYARRVHRDFSQLAELAEVYDKNGICITLKCVLLYKMYL